jgi:hypothetical protein
MSNTAPTENVQSSRVSIGEFAGTGAAVVVASDVRPFEPLSGCAGALDHLSGSRTSGTRSVGRLTEPKELFSIPVVHFDLSAR